MTTRRVSTRPNEMRRRARTAALGLLALTLTVGGLTTSAGSAAAVGDCRFIAHRGGAWDGLTENGMLRMRKSSAAGVRYIEFDVRTSASGTPWLMHDPTVDRTVANATGRVASKTDEQMQAMRLRDGGTVPTLAEVLAFAASHNMDPVVHVKAMTTKSWATLVKQIRAKKLGSRAVILGDASMLNTVEALAPEMLTVLFDEIAQPTEPSRLANFDGAAVTASAVTQENVDAIHSAGKIYWSYGSESVAGWKRLRSLNVDNVAVDRVASYLEYQAAGCPT